MYPIFNLAQGLYSLSLDFCPVLRDKVLNLAIVIFDSLVEALGNEGRRLCDSWNLSSQEVLFLAEEEWVGENGSLQVSRQEHLHLSGSLDVSWWEIWELGPLLKDAVCDPVDEFIYSRASGLLVSWLAIATFASFFSSLKSALCYIVVLFCPRDLSEETDISSSWFFR